MKTQLPLSKSWAIRMIFLDIFYGESFGYKVISLLNKKKKYLCDDIKAALNCAEIYLRGESVYDVGDSGTVCRFLMYFLDGQKFKIKKGKQLIRRKIPSPRSLKKLSMAELLSLGTSQFASAGLLLGAKPIKGMPLKCRLSVEARKSYFKNKGKWIPKEDEVIKRQLNHFLNGGKFRPLIAEDYCYARAFGFITKKEGKRRWPELRNHESNRLEVMEKAMKDLNKKVDVYDDHRITMAVALRQKSLGLPVRINNKKCVSKSWPQFWQWLKENS